MPPILFYRCLQLQLLLCFCFLGCSPDGSDVPPVQGLSYSTNPAIYSINTPIQTNIPRLQSGQATSFSIFPELPTGLALNSETGMITGMPTVLSEITQYTIVAQNLFSATSATLDLKINGLQKFCITDVTYTKILDIGNPGAMETLADPDVLAWGDVAYGYGYFAVFVEKQSRSNTGNAYAVKIIESQTNAQVLEIPIPLVTIRPLQCLDMVFGEKYLGVLLADDVRASLQVDALGYVVLLDYHNTIQSIKAITIPNPGGIAYGGQHFVVTGAQPTTLLPTDGLAMFISEKQPDKPMTLTDVGRHPTQIVHIPLYSFPDPEYSITAYYFATINSQASGETSQVGEHTLSIFSFAIENGVPTMPAFEKSYCGAAPTALGCGNLYLVVASNASDLYFIPATDYNFQTRIPIGYPARNMTYGNQKFAIANSYSNFVTIVDAEQGTVENVITHQAPNQVTFGYPYFLVRHFDAEPLLIDSRTNAVQTISNLSAPNNIQQIGIQGAFTASKSRFLGLTTVYTALGIESRTSNLELINWDAASFWASYGDGYLAVSRIYPDPLGDFITCINSKTYQKFYEIPTIEPGMSCFGNHRFVVLAKDELVIWNTQNTGYIKIAKQQGEWVAFGNDIFAIANRSKPYVTLVDANTDTITAEIELKDSSGKVYQPKWIASGNGCFAVWSTPDKISIDSTLSAWIWIIHPDRPENLIGPLQAGRLFFTSTYATNSPIAFGNSCFVVANSNSNDITIIDAEKEAVIKTIAVGKMPLAVAYSNRCFAIANYKSNTITLWNSVSEIMQTISNVEKPTNIIAGDDRFWITCFSRFQQGVLLDAIEGKIQAHFLFEVEHETKWGSSVFIPE